MSTLALINEFLACKRIAFAGVSGDARDFSRILYNEFVKRGYDILPVNPAGHEVDGSKMYASVTEIDQKAEAVMIMTKPDTAEKVVEECSQAGISLVWLYRGVGQGSVSKRVLEFCAQKNIRVIPGYCPFMFFHDSGFIHRVHRFFMKLGGKYPE